MAGYKETPRQKLIGMLYLVLTALLALNVSKDILDAFMVVNDSMVTSNQSFSSKIAHSYAQFERQNDNQPERVGPYWEQAQEVRSRANELIDYVKELEIELVMASEKKPREEVLERFYSLREVPDPFNPGSRRQEKTLELVKVPTRDKFDATTNLMINQGRAADLAAKIDEYREFLAEAISPQFAERGGLLTNVEGEVRYRDASGVAQDWETHNFFHTITAAAVTILNKIIGEVQSAEFDAINSLMASIGADDFTFDAVTARVIPSATYILSGQTYEADVIVAAVDSRTQPVAKVVRGADRITPANKASAQTITGRDGVISLQFPATGSGMQRYAGVIEMFNPSTQSIDEYPFSGEFIVAPPALTVSPLRMNILYAGVQNPIGISSPGIPMDAIRPIINVGTITKGPGNDWFVEVPADQRAATISASATVDGRTVNLGSFDFRIRQVPAPIARIAGMTDGAIDRNVLLAADAIIPVMEDFDFEGYNFTIQSYTVTTFRGGDVAPLGTITGNRFNDVVRNEIRNARRGQRIYFENIRAVGPGGVVRQLNPINMQIN